MQKIIQESIAAAALLLAVSTVSAETNAEHSTFLGDPGVATAVSKNPLSIGLNNIGYAYDNNPLKPLPGIRVLPVDGNNNGKIDPDEDFYASKDQITKAIAEGRYPSPPARDLYLVTKGLPTNPVVIAFLKYVLTDGQKLNAPVGYIEIPQDKLDKALAKLKK